MISLNEIYDTKYNLGSKEDLSGLVTCLNNQDPDMSITDNYDRTILVNCNSKQELEPKLGKAITKWVGKNNITCPAEYLYTVFPLNATQFIVRI